MQLRIGSMDIALDIWYSGGKELLFRITSKLKIYVLYLFAVSKNENIKV